MPHPGEAARLLGISTAEVQHDRFDTCRRLHETYGAVVLLKGRGTIVHDGERMTVVDRGTPALATAGSGDVLSGVLGALTARSDAPGDTALAGCWLHAVTGERVARQRERGLVAGDLVAALGTVATP